MGAQSGNDVVRLFELVRVHCTNAQLQHTLKQHKPQDQEIRVTGPQERLLYHLRAAFERGTISKEAIATLLSRAEENGRQHIFFYTPTTQDAHELCNSSDRIASDLWGRDWQQSMGFPQFFIDPDGVQWADCRFETRSKSKYSSWTIKMYSGSERNRFIRQEELAHGIFKKVYKRERVREVWLLRWHSFGLFEIRIPTADGTSLRSIQSAVANVWGAVASAIQREQFQPLDLSLARSSLIHSPNGKLYRLGAASFRDGQHGRADFRPSSHEDELLEAPDRQKAIDSFIDCKFLVVYWLNPRGEEWLPKELRTEVGMYLSNELRIGSQATPEAVEYVTRRLFELAANTAKVAS